MVVALAVAGCVPANSAGQVPVAERATESQARSITVIGKGEAAGQPDEAHVTVGVDTFAKVVNEATNENESTIQAILAALTDEGIAAEDIQTSNYNLWAEQLYGEEGPEGIGGYRVSNQVNVTIRDIDKVGDVIAAAINAGANTIYGVNFSVADPAALEAEAREAAIADAQERAESLAALSGVSLGDIVDISEALTQVPYPMMGLGGGGGEAAAVSSIAPGQLSYYVQVQVTYAME
jgi:uncharacterized protein YggE